MMPLVNNQTWGADGELVVDEWVEVSWPPLVGAQIVAVLNAVLGLWTTADAANVAGVPVEHLVAEAEAWAFVLATRGGD